MAIKNIVLAILLTFCITAVLFTAIPVNSTETVNSTVTPSSTVSSTTYDPWKDVNHDGRINVLDLIQVAVDMGGSGDPALNVTVTNMPPDVDTLVWWQTIVNQAGISSPLYNVKGYAHLNLLGRADLTSSDTVTIVVEGAIYNATHTTFSPIIVYSRTLTGYPSNTFSANIPVPSTNFYIIAYGSSSTNYHISLSFYATWN